MNVKLDFSDIKYWIFRNRVKNVRLCIYIIIYKEIKERIKYIERLLKMIKKV